MYGCAILDNSCNLNELPIKSPAASSDEDTAKISEEGWGTQQVCSQHLLVGASSVVTSFYTKAGEIDSQLNFLFLPDYKWKCNILSICSSPLSWFVFIYISSLQAKWQFRFYVSSRRFTEVFWCRLQILVNSGENLHSDSQRRKQPQGRVCVCVCGTTNFRCGVFFCVCVFLFRPAWKRVCNFQSGNSPSASLTRLWHDKQQRPWVCVLVYRGWQHLPVY